MVPGVFSKEVPMNEFEFELGDKVTLTLSTESGIVIGRAEYLESDNQYYVRYLAGDGRQTESWWAEKAIEADDE